jgi:hypothetical protein
MTRFGPIGVESAPLAVSCPESPIHSPFHWYYRFLFFLSTLCGQPSLRSGEINSASPGERQAIVGECRVAVPGGSILG